MNTASHYWLALLSWILVLFGIVMISSVSVTESHAIMQKIHGDGFCDISENNCNDFYLWRQVKNAFLALLAFSAALFFPIRFWRTIAPILFFSVLALLTFLLLGNIAGNWGTAKSWINISFLPSIQPSEIAKMALIFYLATWMDKKERIIQTWSHGFLPFLLLMTPIALLLALQPDFGSLLVIAAIAVTMFFLAGGNLLHIFLGGMTAALIAIPVVLSHDYIQKRIALFFNPDVTDEKYYQVAQALIAVGSGQWTGVGIGNSGQRYGLLPEVQNDMIFAAAAEELGFLRILFLVGAFFMLSLMGYSIAQNARNRFEMLIAGGITTWITFQAFINMAVTLGVMPLTGITLPFVSYGGSSLLTLLFAVGVLVHIGHFSSLPFSREHSPRRRRVRRPHRSGLRRR